MTDWARDDLALAHDLLTEAGMPRGDDHGFHSVAVRVGLLIDERNSLKDELEATRGERDHYWQGLTDVAGWENWQAANGSSPQQVARDCLTAGPGQ